MDAEGARLTWMRGDSHAAWGSTTHSIYIMEVEGVVNKTSMDDANTICKKVFNSNHFFFGMPLFTLTDTNAFISAQSYSCRCLFVSSCSHVLIPEV